MTDDNWVGEVYHARFLEGNAFLWGIQYANGSYPANAYRFADEYAGYCVKCHKLGNTSIPVQGAWELFVANPSATLSDDRSDPPCTADAVMG